MRNIFRHKLKNKSTVRKWVNDEGKLRPASLLILSINRSHATSTQYLLSFQPPPPPLDVFPKIVICKKSKKELTKLVTSHAAPFLISQVAAASLSSSTAMKIISRGGLYCEGQYMSLVMTSIGISFNSACNF